MTILCNDLLYLTWYILQNNARNSERIHISTEPKPSSIAKRNEDVVQLFGTVFHGGTYLQNSFPAGTVFSIL